ncbi:MAG TPA: hypothetical protein VF230_02530 [Acidimicrobiales bacterium]
MSQTSTRRLATLVAAAGALLISSFSPASAAATSGVINDPPNDQRDTSSVRVLGTDAATINDGSSSATDILSVELETAAGPRLVSTMVINGVVPAPGAGLPTDFDGSDATFNGGTYFTLFHNKDKQTNNDNLGSGCSRTGGGRVRDQNGHWADGYYFYLAVNVSFDGTAWVYTPMVGHYDPSPDGAFFFYDLSTEPSMAGLYSMTRTVSGGDTTLELSVDPRVRISDVTCTGGVFVHELAASGDRIANVFGLTTADRSVILPVTVPLSLIGEPDLRAVGGTTSWSDCTNFKGGTTEVCSEGVTPGTPDTLGDGPTCPTPTVGGTLPDNPLWVANPNQACQIDDDAVGNAVLAEFRQSGWDFIASF